MCSVVSNSFVNCSPSGSSVHWIFQARILEWVAFPTRGDLPDSGIEPTSLSVSCIGRWILYHCRSPYKLFTSTMSNMIEFLGNWLMNIKSVIVAPLPCGPEKHPLTCRQGFSLRVSKREDGEWQKRGDWTLIFSK